LKHGGSGLENVSKERSRFLKKAAQRLFLLWAVGSETGTTQINKVFLLLFVHKK
jgi:hypothetical protein